MKLNILKYIIPVFLLTLFSCEDFLTEDPISIVSPDSFFQSESDFNLAVLGAYGTLSGRALYGWWAPATQAGITLEVTTAPNKIEYQLSFDSTYGTAALFWGAYYKLINQCNLILSKIDDADIPEEVKKELEGETLFLRGLAYFDLTRLYGGVPLHLKPTLSVVDTSLPRASVAECYAQIIDDLKKAEAALLIENSFTKGRAAKVSAAGLLAKVYLTMAGEPLQDNSKLQLAHTKLLEIVNKDNPSVSKKPYVNALEADYQSLFVVGTKTGGVTVPANENGPESIFEINFTKIGDGTQGNVFPNVGWVFGNKRASPWLYKMYDDEDYRRSVSYKSNKIQLKWPKTTATFDDHESNWHYLRYADLVLMFAEVENEINGPTDLALRAINAVRERARNANGTPSAEPANYTAVEATSQDVFRDLVEMERRIELALEGGTWFDWMRTGKIQEMVEMQNANGRVYRDAIKLFPIPLQDVSLSGGVLIQNPGY